MQAAVGGVFLAFRVPISQYWCSNCGVRNNCGCLRLCVHQAWLLALMCTLGVACNTNGAVEATLCTLVARLSPGASGCLSVRLRAEELCCEHIDILRDVCLLWTSSGQAREPARCPRPASIRHLSVA